MSKVVDMVATIQLAIAQPELFAAVVEPNLTKSQVAEVRQALANEARSKMVAPIVRQMSTEISQDDRTESAALVAEMLDTLVSVLVSDLPHKTSPNWAGYVLQGIPTIGGRTVKILVSDPRTK